MREKYVEEAFKRWFIFGHHGVPGTVDLSDGDGDVFESISPEAAKELSQARDRFVDELIVIFTKYSDALIRRTGAAR